MFTGLKQRTKDCSDKLSLSQNLIPGNSVPTGIHSGTHVSLLYVADIHSIITLDKYYYSKQTIL